MSSEQTPLRPPEKHPLIQYVAAIEEMCARRRTGEVVERDDAFMDRLDLLWYQLDESDMALVNKITWRSFPEEVDGPEHAEPEYIELDPTIYGVPRLRIK